MQVQLLGAIVCMIGGGAALFGIRGQPAEFNPGLSEYLLAKLPIGVWRVVVTSIGSFVFLFGLLFALGVLE